MVNIIECIVECDSLYGMICLLAFFAFAYMVIRFVLPFTYKIICKICNTLVKYNDIHTKASVKDVSIETNLHR